MKGSLVLAISALGLFLSGCATNHSVPQPIYGTVEDGHGQPIADMPVECYSYSWKSFQPTEFKLLARTTTDARGAFRFSAKGTYPFYTFLLAHRDGIAPAWRECSPYVPHNPERLICPQTASIAGTVVDEAGKPVADASVSVVEARTTFQLAEGQIACDDLTGSLARHLYFTRTSVDGRFTINGLPQNASVALVAEKPGEAFREPPLKTDPIRGGLPAFSAGQQDIKLVMEPGTIIQGRLVAQENGQPLAGINVWLRSEYPLHSSDEGSQMAVSATDGSFRFANVPAGGFFFHPDFPGKPPVRFCERTPISVAAGQTTNVTVSAISTMTGGLLEAKVVDSKSGQPLSDVGVAASKPGFGSDGTTDRRGLALIRLMPGDYDVHAGKRNSSIGSSKVHIESGKTSQLQITLTMVPPVKITGILRDPSGAPVSGVRVGIYSEPITDTHTDAKGKFAIVWNLRPDDAFSYALLARDWERNLALALTWDPSFKSFDLHLQPALTISGIVKSEQGHPITNATLRTSLDVRHTSSWIDNQPITTDANGRYKISVLPPAQTYSILFMAPGFKWQSVHLSPDETATNQLELPPAILKVATDPQHP